MSSPNFLRPSASEKIFNRIFGALVGLGLGFSYNYLLQVRGRKTGRLYSTPVNVLDYEGKRFLVAPRGRTQWVRNAEVSGEVILRKRGTRQLCKLRVVTGDEKLPILKTYLDRYRKAVQRYFPIPAGSPVEQFAPLAENYPAFELLPL